MNALTELNEVLCDFSVSVETGYFEGNAPDSYIVLTPLIDTFDVYADNVPRVTIEEVRVSLFTVHNYTDTISQLVQLLLRAGFTITSRRYIGRDDITDYHNYSIDIAKEYSFTIHD